MKALNIIFKGIEIVAFSILIVWLLSIIGFILFSGIHMNIEYGNLVFYQLVDMPIFGTMPVEVSGDQVLEMYRNYITIM